MTTTDPWAFQRWAYGVTTGNPVRKAVLSMLATMADSESGRCEAKQATIAAGLETTERTVGGHLRALEAAGLIARRPQFRRDRGRRGDEFLLLAPWITEWPDGERVHPEDTSGGATPPSPHVQPEAGGGARTTASNDHATGRSGSASAPAKDRKMVPPDDFPDELRPHAKVIYPMLKQVAIEHGAREVYPRTLALALMAHPRKPLVATAHELVRWAVDPPRPIKDVVGTFATFLKRERDLAATERIDVQGVPQSAPAGNGPGGRPRDAGRTWRSEQRLAVIEGGAAGAAAGAV